MKWLLIMAIVAAASWWVTRPRGSRSAPRKNIKVNQCPHCGVYVEAGTTCSCREKSG